MNDPTFNIFSPRYRELIEYLFGHRDKDVGIAAVYNDHNFKAENLNELVDLGWATVEEGYVRLNNELTMLLESKCGISENVTVSRIVELIDDIEERAFNYEERSSEDGRRSDERRLRRRFLDITSQVRATHRDIKSLVEREIRFEQDVSSKLNQLESYQTKTDKYKMALNKCLGFIRHSDAHEVFQIDAIRRLREQFRRQIRSSQDSAHETGNVIIEYIHKVRDDREFISKLTRLGDLIARKEVHAKTNIEELLEVDKLGPLLRADPIRSTLPCDLWESDPWHDRFVQLAEDFSLIESPRESITIEKKDCEVRSIFVADPDYIHSLFTQQKGDLFNFILKFPFGISDAEEKFEAQLAAYCDILTSRKGWDLFYEERLSSHIRGEIEYLYIGAYPETGENRTKGKIPSTYLSIPS